MKKLIASITSMVLMLSPVAVGAGDSGVDKEARGSIEFTAHGMLHEAQFDAEVKAGEEEGNFKAKTEADMSVEAELEAVKIEPMATGGGTAFFAGPVVKTDIAEAAGKWVSVAVVDSGSEDGTGDFIWLTLTDAATAAANVMNMVKPGPAHAVTDGDIEIESAIELEPEDEDVDEEDDDLLDPDLDEDNSGPGSGSVTLASLGDDDDDDADEDNSGPGNAEDADRDGDEDNSGPGNGGDADED